MIIPVILSGGSGSRLWPLSREKTPKQFLNLMNDMTLLQRTAKRTQEIFADNQTPVIVVTLENMLEETERQLKQISPALARYILLEPEARNTAAAVALAIDYVAKEFGEDSYIWILPADHHIGDDRALKEAMLKAHEGASKGYLVTFGIRPTRPETGYGYIRMGKNLKGTRSASVEKFIEKPDCETAGKLVESGEYLWSSGMHLFNAAAARECFQKCAPESWALVDQATAAPRNHRRPSKEYYSKIQKEPFETAVIEKCNKLAVVPCDPAWSDIGCWESLWEIKSKDENGNATSGQVFCEDTHNSMILAQDRLVGCVGVKDIIVIETPDSILVADKKCNGSLKNLVQTLQKQQRNETIFSPVVYHDWGSVRVMVDTPDTRISEIAIKPQYALAGEMEVPMMQMTVAAGEGAIMLDGIKKPLSKQESINLTQDMIYSIHNLSEEPLKLYVVHFKKMLFDDQDIMPFWSAEPAPKHMAA